MGDNDSILSSSCDRQDTIRHPSWSDDTISGASLAAVLSGGQRTERYNDRERKGRYDADG